MARASAAVYEASPKIRELGVGINVLPHAVKELAELGLLGARRSRIRTRELIYTHRFGQVILRGPRGLDAGFKLPQFWLHRGLSGHVATRGPGPAGPEASAHRASVYLVRPG